MVTLLELKLTIVNCFTRASIIVLLHPRVKAEQSYKKNKVSDSLPVLSAPLRLGGHVEEVTHQGQLNTEMRMLQMVKYGNII